MKSGLVKIKYKPVLLVTPYVVKGELTVIQRREPAGRSPRALEKLCAV